MNVAMPNWTKKSKKVQIYPYIYIFSAVHFLVAVHAFSVAFTPVNYSMEAPNSLDSIFEDAPTEDEKDKLPEISRHLPPPRDVMPIKSALKKPNEPGNLSKRVKFVQSVMAAPVHENSVSM